MTRIERLAPLSGIAAVALLSAGAVTFGFYEYLPDPVEIQGHLTENSARAWTGGYLGVLAALPLLWFGGSLRVFLRAAEGAGRLAAVAFGGVVAAAGLIGIGFGVMMASGARAGAASGIDAIAAALLYDTYATVIGGGVAIALAATIAAYAVVGYRSGAIGRGVVWVSALIALGAVSPLSYIFIALEMVWVIYVSVDLYRRQGKPATAK